MGLMDIGSNNPYAIINPFAAVIDQGMKGWRTTSDRIAAEQKDAAAQAQQAQILEFARQDAERKQQQASLEMQARKALTERVNGTPFTANTGGMMSGQSQAVDPLRNPYGGQALMEPTRTEFNTPAKPMTQQDFLNFNIQYAGTPTAAAAVQNATLMAKENPNEFYQKLLASGKYTPESVVDFAAGKGKLAFAKDPSVVTWSEPFVANVGGKKALVQQSSTGQIKPVIEDKSTTVNVRGDGGVGVIDKATYNAAVKDLPKQRREANAANAGIQKLDTMIELLDTGKAGGLSGEVKAFFAPVIGDAVSEADFYKRLAKSNAGALRQSVVGGGTVSNYENQLLQTISGGGAGARKATRQLLEFYKKEHSNTINIYHDALDGVAQMNPNVVKVFGRVGGNAPKPSGGKRPPLSQF